MAANLNLQCWSITAASNDGVDGGVGAVADTSAPDAVDNWTRALMASMRRYALDVGGGVASVGGTANSIVITTNQGISSAHEAAGFSLRFKAANTNLGATTVAVDGLSTQAVERMDGTALQAGDIIANGIYDISLNSSNGGYTLLGAGTYQTLNANLTAFAGLTSAADRLPYFTGSGTAAVATFTAAGRALVDDADAAAQRTTLGLGTIATQASSSVSITGGTISGTTLGGTFSDAEIAALAGLTSAADRLPYFTGSGTASLATFTAAGRAIVDDADASAQRTTLGLASGATTTVGTAATADTGTSGGTIPLLNGTNTWSGEHTFNEDVTFDSAELTLQGGQLTVSGPSNTVPVVIDRQGTDGVLVQFFNDGASTGNISQAVATVSYNTTSDGRLKINRRPIADTGRLFDSLEPIWFDWAHGKGDGRGFIAQDLQKLRPEAVTPGSEAGPGEEGFESWQADYGKLMPDVVAEIKALRARVTEIEQRATD